MTRTREQIVADLNLIHQAGAAVMDLGENVVARRKGRTMINRGCVPVGVLFRDQKSGEYAGLTIDGKVIWWPTNPAEEKDDEPA